MLPKHAILDDKNLDTIFVEMHKAYGQEKAPMTEVQTRWLLSIALADDKDIDRMYDDFATHMPFGGFFNRCGIFTIKYEKRLMVWLGVMTHEFGIGGMILVGYYVQWWAYRFYSLHGGVYPLTLGDICDHCFPMGVFTKKTVRRFWHMQKVATIPDNLIDHDIAALSFMKPVKK